MYMIRKREDLAPDVILMEVDAPLVAAKAKAGQFIILRIDERGERIPLTIADYNRDAGTVTIVFLIVGKSTAKLATLKEGDSIADFIGPLGHPTNIENFGTVVLVGGGLGIAPIYPVARAMRQVGNQVVSIIGAKSENMLFYVDQMKQVSNRLLITTDDGSVGFKGFVTQLLENEMKNGLDPNLIMGIGPVVMMRALCNLTRSANIRTIVSLNPIMVDGTGMCGSCRVSIGGTTRFVCVDGPEFDGHLVDFEELMNRQRFYLDEESRSVEIFHHGCCGEAQE